MNNRRDSISTFSFWMGCSVNWHDALWYGQRIFLCKFKVSFVMCRYCHYNSRSVICQNIISDKNRNLLVIKGIDCIGTAEDSCFLFLQFCSFQLAFLLRCFFIFFDLLQTFFRSNFINQRMFWCDSDE